MTRPSGRYFETVETAAFLDGLSADDDPARADSLSRT